jgi:LDH2 family malate/lactate/ureidoglycolate dehydrogenase
MCNAGPNVAPYGGAKGVHGTNPLAYALPAGDEVDIVLDIATSVTAYHQISKAARRGQTIPAGWALDATGRGTTDPAAALKGGVLLPFGGHKGYGLGLLVDVMTAALTGAPIGRSMNQRDTNPVEHGQSLLMLAMDPRKFAGVEALKARMAKDLAIVADRKSLRAERPIAAAG